VAKQDADSTNDALDFSIFSTCSLKAKRNDFKSFNVLNRVRSDNFQKQLQNKIWLFDGREV